MHTYALVFRRFLAYFFFFKQKYSLFRYIGQWLNSVLKITTVKSSRSVFRDRKISVNGFPLQLRRHTFWNLIIFRDLLPRIRVHLVGEASHFRTYRRQYLIYHPLFFVQFLRADCVIGVIKFSIEKW